ncbi:MAG TPA: hypothetical protein VFQ00_04210 [Terriglobales bacterium]|nr:hypothetical protein [Terriglobales bacterium]
MKSAWLAALVVASSLFAYAQSSPEEEAISEILLAKNPAAIEKHLPEVLCQALAGMDKRGREQLLSKPLEIMKEKGLKIRQGEGQALAAFDVEDPDSDVHHFEMRTIRRVSNGVEAVLVLGLFSSEKSWGTSEVWLKLEDGEWRVTDFADPSGYGRLNLEDPDTIAQIVHTPEHQNEQTAMMNLQALAGALGDYSDQYPTDGFPSKLDALGGSPPSQPDSDHAQLIDNELATTHVQSGYSFDYERSSVDSFEITARPLDFGKTGSKNFFIDQSRVIRVTEEDRQATAQDPPLYRHYRIQ